MTRVDAATILRGLIPAGADLKRLPRAGKDEITAAVDTVLRLVERKDG